MNKKKTHRYLQKLRYIIPTLYFNFHYLPFRQAILLSDYNRFATGCKVMHSVTTPERCIWGMGTTVTRGCVKKSYCLMGGSPVRILRENVMRDYDHNTSRYD